MGSSKAVDAGFEVCLVHLNGSELSWRPLENQQVVSFSSPPTAYRSRAFLGPHISMNRGDISYLVIFTLYGTALCAAVGLPGAFTVVAAAVD
jgi:hypothetical protein